MRLAGIAKGGFYPLPLIMNEYIISAIAKSDGEESRRILDPCAGHGVAILDISQDIGFTPYACELNTDRANDTMAAFDEIDGLSKANVMCDSYKNIRAERGSFHAMYLNPPYDWDKESGREEYTWLKRLNPLLGDGGLLIWVIPEKVIADKNVRRYLASWFYDMTAYRFVGESYENFKQIVLYGRKRGTQLKADPRVQRNIKQLSELHADMPEHPLFEQPLYDLSDVKVSKKFFFYGIRPSGEAIKIELSSHGIQQREDFQAMMRPGVRVKLDPLAPMKVGHMASTISAGHINNTTIETEDGPVLIKGSVYLEPVQTSSVEDMGKGKTKHKQVTIFDPRAVITTVDEGGEITTLQNSSLANFLEKNIFAVTNKLKRLYPPRYEFKLKEWAGYLKGVNPRRIPNTDRKGLLPAQKHAAAAINQQWLRHRDAILVGQLGTGKTVMSIAAAYAMYRKNRNRNHFIVMCPPHLVEKWLREIGLTWQAYQPDDKTLEPVPQASAMALVRPSDIDRFFDAPGPIFGVMKSTSSSAGSGWQHSLNMDGPLVLRYRKNAKDHPVEIITANPKVREAFAAHQDDEDFFKHYQYLQKHPITCPNVGCWHPVSIDDKKNKGAKIPANLTDFVNRKITCEKCGGPLWQEGAKDAPRRISLASYLKLKYSGMTDILIVDEAHEYKGESSARGYAYGRMVRASKHTLIMTGTIYGGKASTLFFLLFRLSADFRKSWVAYDREAHHRMKRKEWNETYGVVEETITLTEGSSSQSAGNRKPHRSTKEVAGSSPSMLPWLLNRAIFVSLEDMGMALPEYRERVIEVEMEGEMKKQYAKLYQDLSAALAQKLRVNDRSLLSKYLNALIYYPDSAWRPKAVHDTRGKLVTAVPGTQQPVGTHPKERAILDLIQSELAEGRRCLLLTDQTDTLDIQKDWKNLFSMENISASILDVLPNGRERWIAKEEAKGTQVIISNPKKVATGLDILGYPTIIWMAPQFSIYTVMQASGRAYRLGQVNDCLVYHFAYTDTIQNQALRLVIAKSAAAKRVNGDTIDSDDLADLDALASGSIENELAKVLTTSVEQGQKMAEIDLDFEKVSDGLFDGYFADCEDVEQAEQLYRDLVAEHHPDVAGKQQIETLGSLLEKANADFKKESVYLSEFNIREEAPEDVDEDDMITEAIERVVDDVVDVVEDVADVVIEHRPATDSLPAHTVEHYPAQDGLPAHTVTKGKLIPQRVEVVEVEVPTIEHEEAEKITERLVFGQSVIKVSKRKTKKKVDSDVSAAQLSLF